MARKRKPASNIPRSAHWLAIVVISVVTALAFGFPVDPADFGKFALFEDNTSVIDKGEIAEKSELSRVALPFELPNPSSAIPQPLAPATAIGPTDAQKAAEKPDDIPAERSDADTAASVAMSAERTTPVDRPLTPVQTERVAITASLSPLPPPAPLLPTDTEREIDLSTVLPEHVERADGWLLTTVQPGDTLSAIFERLGLRSEDMYALILTSEEAKRLEKLKPSQKFKAMVGESGELMELVYQVNQIKGIKVKRQDSAFIVEPYEHALDVRQAVAVGEVKRSLYVDARKIGLPQKTIAQFGDILGWKIDFSHDVAANDSFVVIYEEKHLNGETHGAGDILALEFINRGKTYRAIGVRDERNRMHYFTPEGRSLKQAFMRNPVDFTRISSHFQASRWHPVKGVRRPHKGVDYAAPTGTPIKASGDGRVSFIGRKGGYGKTVIIDHGRGYTTLYAHMSRYKKGLKTGGAVSQGDIIGYVGATGLATGPHLHYEFRINGKHQNPVTVKLPGQPISPKLKQKFEQQADRLIAELDRSRETKLAASQ